MRSLRRDLLLVQPLPVSLVDSSSTSDLETGRNNRTKVVFHMFFLLQTLVQILEICQYQK